MDWATIIPIIVICIVALLTIIYLITNQKKRIIEWLKYAGSMAEKELGKNTGQLKLRLVYDWFVEKFPIVATVLPFKVFSAWVDVALNTMNGWIDSKGAIGNYIQTGEIITNAEQSK